VFLVISLSASIGKSGAKSSRLSLPEDKAAYRQVTSKLAGDEEIIFARNL
jgi:hypothetical protein